MEKLAISQLQILWALSKSSMNGKRIIERVSAMRGRKVAHPNIYSSLRKMEREGLVKSRRSGRSVEWSITAKGRRRLERMAFLLLESMDDIIEEIKCSRCERACK